MLIFEENLYNKVVGPRSLDHCDRGVTPGGPQDRFSFFSGNLLLDQDRETPGLEILSTQKTVIEFKSNRTFIITGAPIEASLSDPIPMNTVLQGLAGQTLTIEPGLNMGVWSYLCVSGGIDSEQGLNTNITNRQRKSFLSLATWGAPPGVIRAIKGPEFDYCKNWDDRYRVSISTRMGTILKGSPPILSSYNITSGPVSDGTVQYCKDGPIVLQRCHPTIGGYPRVLNVIEPDLDMLAQTRPGLPVRFKLVSYPEAIRLNSEWEESLKNLY